MSAIIGKIVNTKSPDNIEFSIPPSQQLFFNLITPATMISLNLSRVILPGVLIDQGINPDIKVKKSGAKLSLIIALAENMWTLHILTNLMSFFHNDGINTLRLLPDQLDQPAIKLGLALAAYGLTYLTRRKVIS